MQENEIMDNDALPIGEYDAISATEVTEVTSYDVELQSAFPPVEGAFNYNHALLNNREVRDAHPITAITGLREELNDIKSLKTVYSDKKGSADYYEWAEGYVIDGIGRFVTLNQDIYTITICTGHDIFGVVVDNAAFVGGQSGSARDGRYGLVATSGAVNVRCELDVEVGDYVVSNEYGIATKTTSNHGYKVLSLHDIYGDSYATINLTISAEQVDFIGAEIQVLGKRVDANETNILNAINLAQQASDKASNAEASNKVMSDKVDGALGTVDKLEGDVANLGSQVASATTVATQAQAIANSAVASALDLKNQAVAEANKAVEATTRLSNEFNELTTDMETELKKSTLELNAAKENIDSTMKELKGDIDDAVKNFEALQGDLVDLATWQQGDRKGVSGFVAQANENGVTLGGLVSWKEGDGPNSLAGFVSKAAADSAEVKALVEHGWTDDEGNKHYGTAGIMAEVNKNKAEIETITNMGGRLAGLKAQVDENTASVTTLASHIVGEYTTIKAWDSTSEDNNVESIYYEKDGDDNVKYHYHHEGQWTDTDVFSYIPTLDTAKVYYVEEEKVYWYYKDGKWLSTDKSYEAGITSALAGIQQTADANKASIEMVTSLDGEFGKSLAGFVSKTTADIAEVKALVEDGWKDDEGKEHYGTAVIMAKVEENKTAIDLIAGTDGDIAGLQAQVNENASAVALVSKTVEKPYKVVSSESDINKDDTNVAYYVEQTKEYHYYADGKWKQTTDSATAGLPTSIAGIQAKTDNHSASINDLVSWQGSTNIAMARIEQKADANGAYIQSTVANIDRYSVGPHSQAFGFTRKQAQSILEEGMIYVPTGDNIYEEYTGEGDLPTYERTFSQYYLYRWGEVDDGCGWITVDADYSKDKLNTSAPSVFFNSDAMPTVAQCNDYGYWYTNGPTTGTAASYEAYTLYKWDLYDTKDDSGIQTQKRCWVPVATLAGNSQNRAVSQIRQDANSITESVTNMNGDVAASKKWIDDVSTNIQDVVTWTDDSAEAIATTIKSASESEAYISQIAAVKDENGKINAAASIVTAINAQGDSGVSISANHIDLEGAVTFKSFSKETRRKIEADSLDVQIWSSRGNIFKSKDVSTTLTCKVFSGGVDITNNTNLVFTWKKILDDGTEDTTWRATSFGNQVNVIQISTGDVSSRAVFQCQVDVEYSDDEE